MTELILDPRHSANPFVSVIVPIRNEAAHINEVLSAVLLQDYISERIEILIADGMSIDNTRSIIDEFFTKYSHSKIEVLDNAAKIVPTAMNVALRQARGDIIIRLDGHTA